jgi:hypothetical protein
VTCVVTKRSQTRRSCGVAASTGLIEGGLDQADEPALGCAVALPAQALNEIALERGVVGGELSIGAQGVAEAQVSRERGVSGDEVQMVRAAGGRWAAEPAARDKSRIVRLGVPVAGAIE